MCEVGLFDQWDDILARGKWVVVVVERRERSEKRSKLFL